MSYTGRRRNVERCGAGDGSGLEGSDPPAPEEQTGSRRLWEPGDGRRRGCGGNTRARCRAQAPCSPAWGGNVGLTHRQDDRVAPSGRHRPRGGRGVVTGQVLPPFRTLRTGHQDIMPATEGHTSDLTGIWGSRAASWVEARGFPCLGRSVLGNQQVCPASAERKGLICRFAALVGSLCICGHTTPQDWVYVRVSGGHRGCG